MPSRNVCAAELSMGSRRASGLVRGLRGSYRREDQGVCVPSAQHGNRCGLLSCLSKTYCSEPRLAFNRTVVLRYRIYLEQRHLAATTINLRLAAIRDVWLTKRQTPAYSVRNLQPDIRRVRGVRRIGLRLGNWLTADQGKALLSTARNPDLRSKRNYAILAVPLGCGLRRGEMLALTAATIQLREEHWVIADLYGKARHIRTVPIPSWVKAAIDSWTEASGIKEGRTFRSINKAGRIWGDGMTPKVLWEIVKEAAKAAGIEKIAPHDLRRTCARLCHVAEANWIKSNFFWDTSRFNHRALSRVQAKTAIRG